MDRVNTQKGSRQSDPCAGWLALLPDAADGLLSTTEQTALNRHLAVCSRCSGELAAVQRGLAWLTVLKGQTPEPPPSLLSNILAKTTGAAGAHALQPALVPVFAGTEAQVPPRIGWPERVRGWLGLDPAAWSSLVQPRLAMTGAMAFFSICLTLNLTGTSVRQLDAQTLTKAGIHRTVAEKSASILRSIQGIRVVYRVEARVNELRAGNDSPIVER